MSTLSPPFTAEQVYPMWMRLRDELAYAIRHLRKTPHAAGVAHTFGDDMLCSELQLTGSSFLPALTAKRPALMVEARAFLVRFNQMVDAGEVAGPKALLSS